MVELSDEQLARALSLRLEEWTSRQASWVLCHAPDEEELYLWGGAGVECCVATDWTALPRRRGYLIAPFEVTPQTPLVFVDLPHEPIRYRYTATHCPMGKAQPVSTTPDEVYRLDFDRFARVLARGEYDKLVLARALELVRPEGFAPLASFLRAVCHYPSAYTYLLYTPETGMWLGATPEVLISAEGLRCRTMALAGTLPAGGDVAWTQQHRAEQGCVARYIVERLAELGLTPMQSETYTAYAGALAHLRTDIDFALHTAEQIYQVLEHLHPTPAVCGLPKEESLRFIIENESAQRGYYSGCLGLVDPDGQTSVYVNLRCMQVGGSTLRLFAGGGLLAGSQLETEWQETERKLQTMQAIL